MNRRLLVVVLCYLLSSIGIIFVIVGALSLLIHPASIGSTVFVLISLAALAAHFSMSVSWVKGERLGKLTPVIGTVLGVSALFSFPIINPLRPPEHESLFVLFSVGFQAMFVLPNILLAVYLVVYHWNKSSHEA